MTSYRELLTQVKAEIAEIDATDAAVRLDSDDAPVFLDVRERDEWDEGHIPGAVFIPRGNLESRVETALTDKSRPVVVYCAVGARSAFAAKSLVELGYDDVVSLAGGYTDWKRNGFPTRLPRALGEEQRRRYSRHVLIPEVGEEGQLKLLDARILLIGAGGLGSPASLYLAAAGIGTLGIVDDDDVDATNLQRQIVHSTDRLGEPKAESAKRTLEALNPDVTVKTYRERLTSENADRILGEGWDVIVDGADNFPTRYLLNDASVWHSIPIVHGSIYRFEGQVTVFNPRERSLLSLPVPTAAAARARPELRGGRRTRRPARRRRLDSGDRGAEAGARDRRPAGRPAAAVRRARRLVHRGDPSPRSRLPGVRRQPDDHRVRRLRRVLPRHASPRMMVDRP